MNAKEIPNAMLTRKELTLLVTVKFKTLPASKCRFNENMHAIIKTKQLYSNEKKKKIKQDFL